MLLSDCAVERKLWGTDGGVTSTETLLLEELGFDELITDELGLEELTADELGKEELLIDEPPPPTMP